MLLAVLAGNKNYFPFSILADQMSPVLLINAKTNIFKETPGPNNTGSTSSRALWKCATLNGGPKGCFVFGWRCCAQMHVVPSRFDRK